MTPSELKAELERNFPKAKVDIGEELVWVEADYKTGFTISEFMKRYIPNKYREGIIYGQVGKDLSFRSYRYTGE